jgi:hypothetical protein
MSLLKEYIDKRLAAMDLQNELKRLISDYNRLKNTYLLIYAIDFEKGTQISGLNISLIMNDYHVIHELLRNIKRKQ